MITPSPVQTVYNQYEFPGQVGMRATGALWDVTTRIADDPTAAGIGFGLAVSQGDLHGDKSAVIGLASGGAFIGITVADPTLPNLSNISGQFTDKYSNADNMAVAIMGEWWVAPATNVAAGSPVYFNSSTGALGGSGISNATLIEGAIWRTSLPNSETLVNHNGLAVVALGVASAA